MLIIALAIGLSNVLYAQNDLQRPTNDDCSNAIVLPTGKKSSFHAYQLEGAGRSHNLLTSVCEFETASQGDVWFTARIPADGALNVFLKSKNGCPAMAIYQGNCQKMTYLACDARKENDRHKFISIRELELANTDILIRVFAADAFSSNVFEIKAEPNNVITHVTDLLSVNTIDQGIQEMQPEKTQSSTTLSQRTSRVYYCTNSIISGQNNDALGTHTFMHRQPNFGRNDYQLVHLLDNGEQTITNERTINADQFRPEIRVYPNPASTGVTLDLPKRLTTSPAHLVILNTLGQQIHHIPVVLQPNEKLKISFDEYQLTNGIFYLHLVQNDLLLLNQQLSIQK